MWEKVESRLHHPLKIFPFGGEDADEVMLYGTVEYGLRGAGKKTVDWSARAHFVKPDGRLKMDYYQVYLVSSASLRSEQGTYICFGRQPDERVPSSQLWNIGLPYERARTDSHP